MAWALCQIAPTKLSLIVTPNSHIDSLRALGTIWKTRSGVRPTPLSIVSVRPDAYTDRVNKPRIYSVLGRKKLLPNPRFIWAHKYIRILPIRTPGSPISSLRLDKIQRVHVKMYPNTENWTLRHLKISMMSLRGRKPHRLCPTSAPSSIVIFSNSNTRMLYIPIYLLILFGITKKLPKEYIKNFSWHNSVFHIILFSRLTDRQTDGPTESMSILVGNVENYFLLIRATPVAIAEWVSQFCGKYKQVRHVTLRYILFA